MYFDIDANHHNNNKYSKSDRNDYRFAVVRSGRFGFRNTIGLRNNRLCIWFFDVGIYRAAACAFWTESPLGLTSMRLGATIGSGITFFNSAVAIMALLEMFV